ncbi:helix-turn-helix domain-containing protein [Streptomyces sp. ISL-112]|uniref:helix-turn-helix transcriptional regulator n=1 Tax=unclassified Streptomyces TaxID=2593676 RepID=UPI001BE72BCD|nr:MULTISPECIES: helix-turn-helix transcriptional regulator [unclassified Streptomyces]MBT2424653.1 helix-turn-helix domain-containing protein [Streptomyces sp. ISL-112]MBT2465328.1 helix-turn-helix domain-containing protein [Streptomyces sp. ISL-63]
MKQARELGRFLRSRRSHVTPEAAGVPALGRRRVPGLRREEVAGLAGVSTIYYTRLEQGRATNPSDSVLEALARVLRLDATEWAHLHDLAHPPQRPRAESSTLGVRRVRPDVRRLLDTVGAVPAYVLDPGMDVLAANELALALVPGLAGAPAGKPNIARHIFLDAKARSLYPQWDQVARQTIGYLRFSAARHVHHSRLGHVVAELSAASPEFRILWAAQEVQEKTYGTKSFEHPLAGRFDLAYETLSFPGDEGQSLVIFSAIHGSAQSALKRLSASPMEYPQR